MEFKKKTIETLLDDKEKEIKVADFVIYTTKSGNETILAQYLGTKGGYFVFAPFGNPNVNNEYNVKPSSITGIVRAEDFLTL